MGELISSGVAWLLRVLSFQRPEPVDFSFNPLADKKFLFWDPSLLEAVKMGDPHTHEFFRLLSLCHTVMSEEKNEGERRSRLSL